MKRIVHITATSAILIVAAFVSGCENTVEIDLPDDDPALVINSFFWPESTFELCLSDARSVAEGIDAIQWVEDATVELWEGDRRLEMMPYVGSCLYRSTLSRPIPGRTYTVKARAPGYLDAEATDQVPGPVRTEFRHEVDRAGSDGRTIDVTIFLYDPPEVDNWYRLMVLYRHRDREGAVWHESPGFSTDDEAIIADNREFIDLEGNSEFETVFFTDERLDRSGPAHEINIEVRPSYVGGFSSNVDLIVIVDAISRNFFEYGSSERIYRTIGDNPFAEPVQVWSNVRNGFGIFGGFNRETLDVPVE